VYEVWAATGSDATTAPDNAVRTSTEPRINLFMREVSFQGCLVLKITGPKHIDAIPTAFWNAVGIGTPTDWGGCSVASSNLAIGGVFLLNLAAPKN
jgi:hypothetical protein